MASTSANDSPLPSAAVPLDPFLTRLRELLAPGSNGLLNWNSDGKGFSFNRLQLEEHLKSPQSQFNERTLEAFIIQLKQRCFEATAAEATAENDDEDTFLAFQNPGFTREIPPAAAVSPSRPKCAIYCSAERNFLRNKRAHDPCYKLMAAATGTGKIPFDLAKERFRAVLAQQKLKRIINARLQMPPVEGLDVFRDLLPNETNISIQMGAIAGYYGETVVEEDLIKFFGKFLPMYKPISDVVDSITPSISSKIQASSFIWRNGHQSAGDFDQPRHPTAIVTTAKHCGTGGGKHGALAKNMKPPVQAVALDPCNDITFEYVSFKDQMQSPVERTTEEPLSSMVSVVGQGVIPAGHTGDSSIIITHQPRDDFMTISVDCDEAEQLNAGGGGAEGNFSHNLLGSSYYETSSHDFSMELKNAIDLIMN